MACVIRFGPARQKIINNCARPAKISLGPEQSCKNLEFKLFLLLMSISPTPVTSDKTRTMRGLVLRKSGDKTVAVMVSRVVVNAMYQKRRTVTKTYLAHDEGNQAVIGTMVTIRQSRPLSARKRWIISEYPAVEVKSPSKS